MAQPVEHGNHSAARTVLLSAAGGSVILGTAGAGTGLLSGGLLGAACGAIPAIFTFGLSIPVGAAVGSGLGVCAGSFLGSGAGLLSGGTVGYLVVRRMKHKTFKLDDDGSVQALWEAAPQARQRLVEFGASVKQGVADTLADLLTPALEKGLPPALAKTFADERVPPAMVLMMARIMNDDDFKVVMKKFSQAAMSDEELVSSIKAVIQDSLRDADMYKSAMHGVVGSLNPFRREHDVSPRPS